MAIRGEAEDSYFKIGPIFEIRSSSEAVIKLK
jgi:hypothetical protein